MTTALARGVLAPELTSAVLAGEDRALGDVDRVVRQRVLHEPVVRVKVWRRDGVIAYSDVRALIGTRTTFAARTARCLLRPDRSRATSPT